MTNVEALPVPHPDDRVYDRAGNCLNAGCDGSVDTPCECFAGGPPLSIDYDPDEED